MQFAFNIPVNFAKNTEQKAKEVAPVVANMVCGGNALVSDAQVALIPANASLEEVEKIIGKGCPVAPGLIRWTRTGGKPDLEIRSPEI